MPTLVRRLLLALACTCALLGSGSRAHAGDGRLNPDPNEYYALWCAHDFLEIWREVPGETLLERVGLLSLVELGLGETLDLGSSMAMLRATEDVITLSGSNGNQAPAPGSKSFSLSECIARNGGLPPLESVPPEPSSPSTSSMSPGQVDSRADAAAELLLALLYEYCPVLAFAIPSAYRAALGARERGVDLDVFYAVRDEVLAPSVRGQHYIGLFDTHEREILALLAVNWGRAQLARAALLRFQPLLRDLAEGRGARATIKKRDVQQVELLLDHLAAAGSPELAQAIADERARTPLAPLAGLSMESARALLVGCEAIADPFAQAGCALGELLDGSLCAAGAIEPKLAKALRKNVTKGQRALAKASGQVAPRKVARLVAKAGKRLGAIEKSLGKAAATPAECRDAIASGVAERRLLLDALP